MERSAATTADLVAVFHRANPNSDRVFGDWLFTTQWYTRLAAGESVRQMVDTYKQR
jgi:hypothetical protein